MLETPVVRGQMFLALNFNFLEKKTMASCLNFLS